MLNTYAWALSARSVYDIYTLARECATWTGSPAKLWSRRFAENMSDHCRHDILQY